MSAVLDQWESTNTEYGGDSDFTAIVRMIETAGRRHGGHGEEVMSDDVHEVYAVRYAEHARMRSENYIFGDPHDAMTSISYYVWVIKGSHGTFVPPYRTCIAAQSELEGLKQIYTDNNVRVRSVQARINELKRQLEKIGGKGENDSVPVGQQTDSLYPSIRKLPLLGVEFADLYRRTRVQEAVFESLTKEYELAKVQEVKRNSSRKGA